MIPQNLHSSEESETRSKQVSQVGTSKWIDHQGEETAHEWATFGRVPFTDGVHVAWVRNPESACVIHCVALSPGSRAVAFI